MSGASARPAVVYDTRDLALSRGTGIATYSRELLAAAHALQFSPWGLVDTAGRPRSGDALLSQIQIASGPEVFGPEAFVREALTWAVGRPFGIPARPIAVGAPGPGGSAGALSSFDKVFGASRLFNAAHNHFSRYGRRLTVHLPGHPVLFHATSPMALRVPGCANIYTIHDLVPILFPSMTTDNKVHFLAMLREIARTADHIVTVSEHSRRDIIRHLGVDEARVTNTYQCLESDVAFWASPEAAAAVAECVEGHGLEPQGYFVFVGSIEPKKNVSRLIDAYSRAKGRLPLLVIGRDGWLFEQDNKRIQDEQFLRYHLIDGVLVPHRTVRRHPYLPRDEVMKLIRGARALLFPSLYEGFGLPVLEAMQLGVPVLTSDQGALPEVTAGAALTVDPSDTAAIARAIRQLEADDDLCRELAAKGQARAQDFTPAHYHRRLGSLYKSLT